MAKPNPNGGINQRNRRSTMRDMIGALAFTAAFAFAQSAVAVPSLGVSLDGSPYDDPSYDTVLDTGSEFLQLTDVDGSNDDTNVLVLAEFAGYAASNELYLYDTTDPSDTLLIFGGAAGVLDSTTLEYNAGTWTNLTTADSITAGITFGLLLISPEGMFYSDTSLNADGVDHFAVYETQGVGGLVGLFDTVVGAEDLYGGGDFDYDDMVVGFTDVVPFNVSAPNALALMGLGLIGMVGLRKQV